MAEATAFGATRIVLNGCFFEPVGWQTVTLYWYSAAEPEVLPAIAGPPTTARGRKNATETAIAATRLRLCAFGLTFHPQARYPMKLFLPHESGIPNPGPQRLSHVHPGVRGGRLRSSATHIEAVRRQRLPSTGLRPPASVLGRLRSGSHRSRRFGGSCWRCVTLDIEVFRQPPESVGEFFPCTPFKMEAFESEKSVASCIPLLGRHKDFVTSRLGARWKRSDYFRLLLGVACCPMCCPPLP
jgi:hypothetical protein